MKIKNKRAFTLVELLTVISIITIIIGLLVPGLNKVRKIAKDTKQKAQFHSLEVGLEVFKTEDGEYPDSGTLGNTGFKVCGANLLAEALIGLDLQGYDPVYNLKQLYPPISSPFNATNLKSDESMERRKEPYLNLENMGAFNIGQIYSDTGDLYKGNINLDGTLVNTTDIPAPVITDIYNAKKITLLINPGGTNPVGKSVNAGTPVLYFKVDIASKEFDYTDSSFNPDTAMYNYRDNEAIIDLGQVKDQIKEHKVKEDDTAGKGIPFYEAITNPSVSTVLRPNRADSFILWSAGYDGVYGTDDDIFNFGN